MTTTTNPSTDARAQKIEDLRTLVDFIADHPDLPVGTHPGSYCIVADTDEAGMAELRRVALILGVDVTTSGGTHYYANRRFGTAGYQAFYVPTESMSAYQVEKQAIRDRRRCGCGATLTDTDLIAGKKRCAACVPGEPVEGCTR